MKLLLSQGYLRVYLEVFECYLDVERPPQVPPTLTGTESGDGVWRCGLSEVDGAVLGHQGGVLVTESC